MENLERSWTMMVPKGFSGDRAAAIIRWNPGRLSVASFVLVLPGHFEALFIRELADRFELRHEGLPGESMSSRRW